MGFLKSAGKELIYTLLLVKTVCASVCMSVNGGCAADRQRCSWPGGSR